MTWAVTPPDIVTLGISPSARFEAESGGQHEARHGAGQDSGISGRTERSLNFQDLTIPGYDDDVVVSLPPYV